MSTPQPSISIIIRCYNEERHIRRLLESVLGQNTKDYEIIIVDSGSTDRTLEIVRQYDVRIVSIAPEDFSFGYALNSGCKQARGEFLVFVSAHVYPTSSLWLQKLIEMFDDSRVALVYGKQRGNHLTAYFEHRIFRKLYPDTSIRLKNDPFCNNACAAIRKQLWEQYPFDEELTGLEDIAWAKRIIEAGYYLAYCAEAEIVHVHDETPGQRFNRYKREAIALKRIFPDSHFGLADMMWLYASNCVSDLIAAYHDRLIKEKFTEIFQARWHQFTGTYSGYRLKGELAKQMKMQFFYPDFLESSAKRNMPEPAAAHPKVASNESIPRIVALVPMRADSKRVPNKNVRLFNGKPLYWHILTALLDCPYIEEVYVNTNSELLTEELPRSFDRVRIISRPQNLCADTVPMTEILLHDVEFVRSDWYLQTHATNPLLRTETLTRAIETLLNDLQCDSLFGVTPLQTRLWTKAGKPLNHDPKILLRTQDLEPIFEENSNIYIFKAETLKRLNSRIGERPLMFEIPREEAWDIDEELDFRIAEFLDSQRKYAVTREQSTAKGVRLGAPS
ncbi:MAG: glycosyltransferase [Deltaproteobacteria bacterium]|nr:glycosyltransferase [Deltaproteobacteria bacterium]